MKLPAVRKYNTLHFILFIFTIVFHLHCKDKEEKDKTILKQPEDYIKPIRGNDDSISIDAIQKGKVLIGYADCYTCHKEDQRSVGPAFKDIAKRYPVKEAYINYLGKKVIAGGSRSWGYPVMTPHPNLSLEDAKMMVTYILSLDMNK